MCADDKISYTFIIFIYAHTRAHTHTHTHTGTWRNVRLVLFGLEIYDDNIAINSFKHCFY